MEDGKTSHEDFMGFVQKHLADREGCPTLLILHTPMGMELQANFSDFALQIGLLDVAKLTTRLAFENRSRELIASGENRLYTDNIKDITEGKKKVN